MASRVAQLPSCSFSSHLLLLWCLVCTSTVLSTTPSQTESGPRIRTTSGIWEPLAPFRGSASLPELLVSKHAEDSEAYETWVMLDEAPAALHQTGVSLPVDNPTKSFWLDTPGANPLAEAGSTGELTQDADICVIGSGITGVSAAWHLSNLLHDEFAPDDKANVVILEAREFCSGATGRNGGHLLPNAFYSFRSRQALYNTSEVLKTYIIEDYTAKSIVKFIKGKTLDDAVDLVEGGHVTLFRTEEEEINSRKDYEAAIAAGLVYESRDDLGVRWIGNDELVKKYGLSSELNYTGVYFGGHNLWPCKVVTELFQDAQSSSKNVNVALHTKTPVTRIVPADNFGAPGEQSPLTFSDFQKMHRRWTLDTPRGDIQCSYVIHATNGYAGQLLPFMAESSPPRTCCKPPQHSGHASNAHSLPSLPHHPIKLSDSSFSRPPIPIPIPHPHPHIPRNVHTIVPTRGQAGAVRASVNASELGWLNSWDVGGGWEYWFPRYQESAAGKNPLIILGGGRDSTGGRLEAGVTDDSVLNPLVSRVLRDFLPRIFPSQFVSLDGEKEEKDQWEMEWTGIMGFTTSGDPFVGPIGPLVERPLESEGYHNEGQYIAAGYSGHGMPRAYACAEAVAGMIAAKIRGEEWTVPKWLPESYLTWAKKV